jgi:hypothetical protein
VLVATPTKDSNALLQTDGRIRNTPILFGILGYRCGARILRLWSHSRSHPECRKFLVGQQISSDSQLTFPAANAGFAGKSGP